MKDRELRCPGCGSARIVPIIYGYPTEGALEMAKRGEAVLGGCLVFDDAPNGRVRGLSEAVQPKTRSAQFS